MKLISREMSSSLLAVLVSVSIATNLLPSSAMAGREVATDAQAALRTLVKKGLEENQELIAMRKEVEAAGAMLRQSRLLPNPTIEVRRATDRDGMGESTMAGASLPLELSGTRGARIRIAEAELMVRTQALRARELTLAYEISVAVVEVAAAKLKYENLRRRVEFAQRALDLTSQAVRDGRKAPLDQGLEGVDLNRMRAMLERAFVAQEEKRNALRNLLGQGPDFVLPELTGIPAVGEVLGDLPGFLDGGMARRPDLNGARALETLAAARISAAKADGRPQTELMAGYESSTNRFGAFGVDGSGMPMSLDKEMRMLSFGVKITIPVADRNQGAVAAAKAEAEAARQRRIFGETTVRREIATARMRAQRAERAAQIMRVGVLEQARRNLDVIRESYDLGARSLSEYLAEQQKLIDVENEFIEAEAELAISRLELLRAIGSEELVKQ